MVTVLLFLPLMLTTTGMLLPMVAACGTVTLIWLSPTKPGAVPEKFTVAGIPSMVTVAGTAVVLPAEGEPVSRGGEVAPRPVRKMVTISPRRAGRLVRPGTLPAGSARVSGGDAKGIRIAPGPVPCWFSVKIPG